MKKVFICSPYRSEDYLTQIKNCDNAKNYCRFAALNGVAVFAPHVLYTQVLFDGVDEERQIGIESGIEFLDVCDELWVFVDFIEDISEGMKMEIDHFSLNCPGRPIRYFSTQMIEIKDLPSKEE